MKSDPKWTDLKPQQQRVLAPLKDEWRQLDAQRKRKWVGVANRYPNMKPEEQARVQRRMKYWASLTPAERQAARSSFQTVRKLPADQKGQIREKWKQYQSLPEEQAARRGLGRGAPPGGDDEAGRTRRGSQRASTLPPRRRRRSDRGLGNADAPAGLPAGSRAWCTKSLLVAALVLFATLVFPGAATSALGWARAMCCSATSCSS